MSSDEFEFDEAFMREARIGLIVLTVLMAIFLYVAFAKLSGWNAPNPMAFQGQTRVAEAEMPGASEEELATRTPSISTPSISTPLISTSSTEMPDDSTFKPFANEPLSKSAGMSPPQQSTLRAKDEEGFSPSPDSPSYKEPQDKNVVSQIPTEPLAIPTADPPTDEPVVRPVGQFVPVPSPQKQGVQEESKATPDSAGKSESANKQPKLPWNLKLPTFGGTGKRAVVPASSAKNASSVSEPPVKTASASSFIPGRTAKSKPESKRLNAPFERPEKNAFQPKANEPSLAVSKFPDAEPLPALPATTLVEEGEGFWLVAQRVYGDGRFFDALYQANRKRVKSFNEVPAGTEILTPSIDELRSRWSFLCPREVIKTSGGETLFDVASEQLGQASRYVEILKLNRSRLPKNITQTTPLKAGISLELPNKR